MRQNTVLKAVICVVASLGFLSVLFLAFAFASGADNSLGGRVEIGSSRGVAHFIMGMHHELLGRLPEAVAEYEEAMRLDSTAFAPHLHLGSTLARMGRYARAEEELRLASLKDPEDLQSRYNLALVYSVKKDYDSAAREFEVILKSASKKEPANADILLYLGQLYASKGDNAKAITQFEKVLELQPDNADILYVLGAYYLEEKRDIEAEKLLRDCLKIEPKHDGCLNSLGYALAESGKNLDEARDLLKLALEIAPDSGAYLDSLGWVYYKQALYQEALSELNKAALIIKDPTIYDHIAETYLKLDQVDMARKYWQMSLELDPDQPEIKGKLGTLEPGTN